MTLRILHFADLHLDSTFRWLSEDAARRRRQNLRDTLTRIVDLALEEKVDGVFSGGDLYEQERFTPDTANFVRESFARLQPIPVFVAPGNHDWYARDSVYAREDWTANVHVFRNNAFEPVELEDGLTLWGAAHIVPARTPDLLESFSADRSGTNIALFHGSERAWFTDQEEGKEPHAPFDEEEIRASGLLHAFLGHFHTPKDANLFTYPGNPDPLTFGEEGERGVVLATVGDDEVRRKRISVAVSEVIDLELDISGSGNLEDVRGRVRESIDGISGYARVTLCGEIGPDVDLRPRDLQELGTDLQGFVIQLNGVVPSYDLETLSKERTVRGQFLRDVLESDLEVDQKRRVAATGLRALDDRRDDLEVM